MTRMVNCVKLGKEAEGLKFLPYPGALGKKVFETISQEAWNAWLQHQTMLINEYRLSPADPRTRQQIEEEMNKFLFEEVDSTPPPDYVPPTV
ncbi:oxidative damage protection protein [Candidatus Parabeggiatoa sp. HSG14]|uniref:oxidative damage protection protein n=1 Tax=Candidatus Parabeggiatoa sp. HSG14 TaxID=3055593 RepID=UPI0025A78990|nr:oxidative damage protection protein [Thiotrichales bacterium HSG14]